MMRNQFAIIFLFCGFLVWFGCAVNNGASSQIQKGHEFFAEQRYDEAIGAYQQASKQAPDSIDLFNYIGLAYAAQQRWNKAIAAYQEALKISPDIPEVYINLGFAYQQLKRLDDAIVAYQTALSIDSKQAIAHYRLGLAYETKKQYGLAQDRYLSVINLETESQVNRAESGGDQETQKNELLAHAYYHIGIIYQIQGLFESAIDAYQKAVAVLSSLADVHYRLGQSYYATYYYNAAVIAYQAALEFVNVTPLSATSSFFSQISHALPIPADIQYHLGLTQAAQGKFAEAVHTYEETVALQPNHADAYYHMGIAHLAQKRYIAAMKAFQNSGFHYSNRKAYREARAAYEEVLRAYQALQYLKRAGSEDEKAPSGEELTKSASGKELTEIEKRQRLVEIEEVLTTTYDQLGTVRTELMKFDLAIDDYRRAGEFYEEHGRFEDAINAYNRQAIPILYRIAETYIYIAELALAQGDMAAMIDAIQRAMEKAAKSPVLLRRLAEIYLKAGMSDDAVQIFQRALEIDPEAIELNHRLAQIYEMLGEIEEAEKIYHNILRLAPLDIEARQRLGQIFRQQNKKIPAVEIYQQLGEIYLYQRKWESMIEAYKTALIIMPDVAAYYYQLGWASAQHGKHTAAVEAYHRVLDLWIGVNGSSNRFDSVPSLSGERKPLTQTRRVNFWKLVFHDENTPDFLLGTADQFLVPRDIFSRGESELREAFPPTRGESRSSYSKLWQPSWPSREHIYYQIGMSEVAQGNYANGARAFEKIILKRNMPQAVNAYSLASNQAVDFYSSGTNLKHLISNAFYQLGIAYQALGETKRASQAYSELLKLRPDFAPGHSGLANLHRHLRKYDKAISAYLDAIALGESNPEVYFYLAELFERTGKLVEAIQSYNQAGKGYIREAMQTDLPKETLDKALTAYQKTIQLSRRLLTSQLVDEHTLELKNWLALAYYRVGLILQQWNHPEQAVEQFKLSQQIYLSLPQQLSPSSVQSLSSPSGNRSVLGEADSHLSDLDLAYMFYASGLAYMQLDQLGHAIEAFDQVVEINRHAVHKVDEWVLANTYYELGRIYAMQNRHIKAIDTYPKALVAKPNHLAARYHLGLSYYALRKFQDAIRTYETILLMVPLDCQLLLESCDMIRLPAETTPQQLGASQLLLFNLQSATAARQRANIDRQFVRTYLPLTYRQLGTTYETYSAYDPLNTTLWLKDDAINYYKAGLTYEAQGEYDQAHNAYRVVVRIYEELAEIEKAMLATESEARFEEFVRLFAVEAHLQSGNLHRARSERTRALEDYHEALESYQSALQLEPQRIEALIQRGNMHTHKREWADAMTQYQNALAVEEQALATLYHRQGRSHQARQKNDEALTAYNEALKSRKLPIVYAQLGRVYMSQENPKTALENFNEALSLIPLQKGDLLLEKEVQPYEVQAHTLSGDVYFDSGRAKEMQKQFHEAIADFSNAGHEYFEAAAATRRLGGTSVDFNQMSELLSQASASYKKVLLIGQYRIIEFSQLESDMLLAEANYQIGRVHARASGVYTLQKKPNESERMYDQSERDFQKAIALCHKHSLEDMPDYHPTLLADIHFEKGRLYTDREIRLGFAIQEYEFAGLNYEDGRYFSHAVKAYNAIVEIDPDYANPYFYLGRTYERYAIAHEAAEFDKYIEAAIAYYQLALQKSIPAESSTRTSGSNVRVKSASQTRFNTPQLMLQARYGLARCYDYIGSFRQSITEFKRILDELLAQQTNGLSIDELLLETAYRQIAELGPAAITEFSPDLPLGANLLSDTEIYYFIGLARAHLEVYAGAIDMYDEAILRLDAVVNETVDGNPDASALNLLADIYRNRGVAFTALGDFESAYQSYQQAATRYKKLRQYWQRQVDAYPKEQILHDSSERQRLGDQLNHAYHQAEATYEKAIGIRPDDPQAVFRLGLLYESQKEFVKAQKIYDALSKERDHIVSTYRLGLIYFMQLEDYEISVDAIQPSFKDRAEAQFQHVIEASLDTDVPPILVAQSHAYLGLIAAAEIKFLSSIQVEFFVSDLDDNNISPALRQELEKQDIRLSESAAVLIEREGSKWLIENYPETYSVRRDRDKLYIYQGNVFIALAEFNLANESLAPSQKVIPPDQLGVESIKSLDAQVYRNYYLGLANAVRSKFGDTDFSAAVSAYQLSIEAYPAFSHAYYQLGAVYYDVQNYQLAKRQFENAFQLYKSSENDHPNRANAYYQLGYIFYQTGDYDSAWRHLHLAKVNGKQNVEMSEYEKREKRLDLERNLRRVSISPIRY